MIKRPVNADDSKMTEELKAMQKFAQSVQYDSSIKNDVANVSIDAFNSAIKAAGFTTGFYTLSRRGEGNGFIPDVK